jgi:hypothetical protein
MRVKRPRVTAAMNTDTNNKTAPPENKQTHEMKTYKIPHGPT